MPRVCRRPVLKIRYRKPGKIFGTALSETKNGSKRSKGRILSIRKLSYEQLNRVGEYLPFDPEALLREFREQERQEVKGGIA